MAGSLTTRVLIVSCLLCASAAGCHAQARAEQLNGIPPQLRQRAADRLNQFIEAQRSGNWIQVSELLGNYFYGWGSKRIRYSPEQKAWTVAHLKQDPMLAFTPRRASWSTAILALPLGLRYWTIQGDARYVEDTSALALNAAFVAYRDRDDWYFFPPIRDHCHEFRLFPPDFSERGKAEQRLPTLSLEPQPNLPLEAYDLKVSREGDSPCSQSRLVTFQIRNRSRKTITRYGFIIEDIRKGGAVSIGTSIHLQPGEATAGPEKVSFTAYRPHVMRIDFVRFSDGTTWSPKRMSKLKRGTR